MKTSFQNTKSGAEEQFLPQGCGAKAAIEGVFFSQTPAGCRRGATPKADRDLERNYVALHAGYSRSFEMMKKNYGERGCSNYVLV